MFEKLIEALERIATAAERIAAYLNNAPNKAAPAAAPGKAAGKDTKKDEAGNKTEFSGKPSSASNPKMPTDGDDGLGDEPKVISFEDMRAKLIAVKGHQKLGQTKSSAILAKYGKLPDIKESDYPAVVAECDKLLKTVGA